MVISHITKAIAKITAKKIVKSSDSAVNNKRKLTPEQIKNINEKYDQDSHVQAYYKQKDADLGASYEGTARVDSLTNRIVDPDSKHILSQDLLANPDSMWGRDGRMKITNKKVYEARVRQIKKAEKVEESTPEYKALKKKNSAKYRASEKKYTNAGYEGFESPNKIKIVSRDSFIGREIKDKGVVPLKNIYHEVSGEPVMGQDFNRYMAGGNAPKGFVRARHADEPVTGPNVKDPYGHIDPNDVPMYRDDVMYRNFGNIFGSTAREWKIANVNPAERTRTTATGDKSKKLSWWQKLNAVSYDDGSIESMKYPFTGRSDDGKKKVVGYAYGITGKKKSVKKSKKKVGKPSKLNKISENLIKFSDDPFFFWQPKK